MAMPRNGQLYRATRATCPLVRTRRDLKPWRELAGSAIGYDNRMKVPRGWLLKHAALVRPYSRWTGCAVRSEDSPEKAVDSKQARD